MKKVLSIVLALAMTMSLAACGSKDKPDDSKGSASSGAGTSASTPSTSGEPVEVLWWTAFGQANQAGLYRPGRSALHVLWSCGERSYVRHG